MYLFHADQTCERMNGAHSYVFVMLRLCSSAETLFSLVLFVPKALRFYQYVQQEVIRAKSKRKQQQTL